MNRQIAGGSIQLSTISDGAKTVPYRAVRFCNLIQIVFPTQRSMFHQTKPPAKPEVLSGETWINFFCLQSLRYAFSSEDQCRQNKAIGKDGGPLIRNPVLFFAAKSIYRNPVLCECFYADGISEGFGLHAILIDRIGAVYDCTLRQVEVAEAGGVKVQVFSPITSLEPSFTSFFL